MNTRMNQIRNSNRPDPGIFKMYDVYLRSSPQGTYDPVDP